MSTSHCSSSREDRTPDPIEQAALEWFARCNRGLSPEDEAAFEAWLLADPRHAAVLNEYQSTWSRLETVRSPVDTSAQGRAATKPKRARRFWVPLAAAAVVSLGAFWLQQDQAMHYREQAVTARGEVATRTLPDGSTIRLNTESVVTVAYTVKQRAVVLNRGEAHFDIARDATRPFIVTVNGVVVRAIGTAFNIRLHADAVEVLVTHGRVALNPPDSPTPVSGQAAPVDAARQLVAGERARVAFASSSDTTTEPIVRVTSVAADEMQRQLAWQERRLEFGAVPLAEMVAEFNRYNRHQLVIDDPTLATRRFGGSFKPDDFEGLVRMLEENFGVVAEGRENQTILRLAR